MKTLQLQRQGVSDTVKGNLEVKKGVSFHVEFGFHHGNREFYGKADCYIDNDTFKGKGSKYFTSSDKDKVKAQVKAFICKAYGIKFEYSDFIEGYCFPFGDDLSRVGEWAERQKDDKYLTLAVYCPFTNTIRHARTNVCLVQWQDEDINKPDFAFDGANKPYRKICEENHGHFLQDVNQRQGDMYAKGWLAWIIGECIKDELKEKPLTLKSVTSGVQYSFKKSNPKIVGAKIASL